MRNYASEDRARFRCQNDKIGKDLPEKRQKKKSFCRGTIALHMPDSLLASVETSNGNARYVSHALQRKFIARACLLPRKRHT
eukprot:927063-Pleurochrysis_carterae.AAC.1